MTMKGILSLLLGAMLAITACSSPGTTQDYDLSTVEVIKAEDVQQLVQDRQYTAIYFWTTWCAPCRSTLKNQIKPILDTLKRDDMQVLIVALSKKPEKVQEIIDKTGIKQTTFVVNDYTFNNALADKKRMNNIIKSLAPDMDFLNKVPVVLVVDKDGKVYGDTYSIYDLSRFLRGEL